MAERKYNRMANLDDIAEIKKLDSSRCLASIAYLPQQCQAAWEEVKDVNFPEEYQKFSSIIFCGMGGSAYGGRIIKSLYPEKIGVPVDLVSDYHLPAYVDKNSLLIAASYSGNTEETLSAAQEALKVGAKIIGISSGGKLVSLLKNSGKPVYTFSTAFNPSQQPRLGQGYMQMGMLAILNKLGTISIDDGEIRQFIADLVDAQGLLRVEVPAEINPAKQQASLSAEKIVNIIGAEFLAGAVHAIRNPLHETGKHFANYFILPEANHHLMEGLAYPAYNKLKLIFWLIDSPLYSAELKKRLMLTKEVIEKNNILTSTVNLTFSSKLGQIFELIQFGSFVSFYLAMIHHVDPNEIPWVDYFKEKLTR